MVPISMLAFFAIFLYDLFVLGRVFFDRRQGWSIHFESEVQNTQTMVSILNAEFCF